MIRINLAKSIPIATVANNAEVMEGNLELGSQDIQKQGMIRLAVMLLFPLGLLVYEKQNIPDLQRTFKQKTAELNKLQAKNNAAKGAVEEILKFNEDKEKLQNQVDTLENLQKDRLREVKILDNIQKDIPEKVWLKRIEFKDTELKIFGTSTGDPEIASFVDNLSKMVFLTSVIPVKSADEVSDKGIFKTFELSCKIDRPSVSKGSSR